MKKKFEGWKIKDFKKKWPGGESQLFANIHTYLMNFNIEEYNKLIKEPIFGDIKAYYAAVKEIPVEQQMGQTGRDNLTFQLIPWMNKVMDYLQLNEAVVRE